MSPERLDCHLVWLRHNPPLPIHHNHLPPLRPPLRLCRPFRVYPPPEHNRQRRNRLTPEMGTHRTFPRVPPPIRPQLPILVTRNLHHLRLLDLIHPAHPLRHNPRDPLLNIVQRPLLHLRRLFLQPRQPLGNMLRRKTKLDLHTHDTSSFRHQNNRRYTSTPASVSRKTLIRLPSTSSLTTSPSRIIG